MSNERVVTLADLDEKQAVSLLRQDIMKEGTAESIEAAVPKFHKQEFQNFYAEYGVVNDDLVVHFYLPKSINYSALDSRAQQRLSDWWAGTFPQVLSDVAPAAFKAEFPRVIAKYTEEVASWWFCARGFASALDPQALLRVFLEKLDSALSGAVSN